MKHYLWVRWSDKCKEAFEITENAAKWIDKNLCDIGLPIEEDDRPYIFSTPSGHNIRICILKALAFKIVTCEINPLEDNKYYDDPIN